MAKAKISVIFGKSTLIDICNIPPMLTGKHLTLNVKKTLTEDSSKFTEIVVGLKKGKKRRCSDGKTSNT